MTGIREIAPARLRQWLEVEPEGTFVLDVREAWEFELARIEGSVHIPLGELAGRVAEVPRELRVVVVCHHGFRSQMGCRVLAADGPRRLYNLTGGVERWSVEVDPAVPRY